MKKSIIQLAVKTARMKLKDHPELEKGFIHYSFIVQESKVLGYATNAKFELPKHFGYNRRDSTHQFKAKLHAEIWAYKKVKGILDKYKDFFVLNIRLNKAGELKLSKPCTICYSLLSCLNCKKIYYSSGIENSFLEQKV